MSRTHPLPLCLAALATIAILGPPALAAQSAPDSAAVRDPHAVQPERPTVATHAYTVARGWLELETGFEADRQPDRSHTILTPTVLKIGVGGRAQLDILGSTTKQADQSVGVGDLSAALKLRVADDLPLVGDFSIQPTIKLPTASVSRDLGTGTTDLGLLLITSREFGAAELDLNVGATIRSGDQSRASRTATLWTVSMALPVSGSLGWALESFGYPGTGGPAGTPAIVGLLTGPTFTVRPWLAIDAGVIEPITGPQPRAIYSGLVWNLGCVLTTRSCHATPNAK